MSGQLSFFLHPRPPPVSLHKGPPELLCGARHCPSRSVLGDPESLGSWDQYLFIPHFAPIWAKRGVLKMTSWENVARVGLSSSDSRRETFQVLHLHLKAISVSDSYVLCSLMLLFLMGPPVMVIRRVLGVEDGVLFKILDSLRINFEFLAVQRQSMSRHGPLY